MKSTKDGGPAFPAQPTCELPHGTQIVLGHPGMSMRDWFAGQVIAGLVAHHGADDFHHRGALESLAYCRADAMLAARETPSLAAANEQSESDLLLFARACTGGHVMVDTNDDELHVKSGPRAGPWEWPLAGLIEDGVPVFTDELRAALRRVLEEGQVQP